MGGHGLQAPRPVHSPIRSSRGRTGDTSSEAEDVRRASDLGPWRRRIRAGPPPRARVGEVGTRPTSTPIEAVKRPSLSGGRGPVGRDSGSAVERAGGQRILLAVADGGRVGEGRIV